MAIPLAAALAAIAVGSGLQGYAAKKQSRQQLSFLDRARELSRQREQAGLTRIRDAAESMGGEERQQNLDMAQDAATERLAADITNAREGLESGATERASSGRVSGAYDQASAQRTVDNARRALVMARLLGNVRGLSDLDVGEGINLSRAGSEAAGQFDTARELFQAGSNAASLVEPDFRYQLAGSLLQGFGQGAAAFPGGGSAGTTTAGPGTHAVTLDPASRAAFSRFRAPLPTPYGY